MTRAHGEATTTIRPATKADVPVLLALVHELALYEKAAHEVVATEADFLTHGFGERPSFEALIAETNAKVTGFALYFFGFSTWTGTSVLYLEDLFVRPEDRQKGAGLALMRALAQEATAHGCRRFVWQVLDWNDSAIGFYESFGALVRREWLTVRLEGDDLTRLATSLP